MLLLYVSISKNYTCYNQSATLKKNYSKAMDASTIIIIIVAIIVGGIMGQRYLNKKKSDRDC